MSERFFTEDRKPGEYDEKQIKMDSRLYCSAAEIVPLHIFQLSTDGCVKGRNFSSKEISAVTVGRRLICCDFKLSHWSVSP